LREMHDNSEAVNLLKVLERRLESLKELYSSDLISENTLAGQILELLVTNEAKTYWDLEMKKDMTARRMLKMLEDPDQWEKDAAVPEEDRKNILKQRLVDIFLEDDQPYDLVLEKLLDTVNVPHFETLVFNRSDRQPKKKGAKLSILD